MPERVVRLIGRDVGFAVSVAFSGGQVPGALGLGQPIAAPAFPEVQVRLGYPAPPFGPPVREGSRRAEVGHAAGAGQFIDVGSDPLQDCGHPGQVGHHQRPAGVIAVGTQVDRRGILAGVQVGQLAGALADPVRLIDQAVANQVAPVQLGIIVPIEVFCYRPARGPQLAQHGIQLV